MKASNKETFNKKEDWSQTTGMIASLRANDIKKKYKHVNNGYPYSNSCNVIYKAQNRLGNNTHGSGDNDRPRRNQPWKPQKLYFLFDILRNLDNVNTRFAIETKDEKDGITLDAAFSRK